MDKGNRMTPHNGITKAARQSGVPARYRRVTLDDYVIEDGYGDSDAKAAVAAWLVNIDEHAASGRGLLLTGPSGTGKTMLAAIVLNEICSDRFKWHPYLGTHLRGRFIRMPDYFAYKNLVADVLKDPDPTPEDLGERNYAKQLLRDIRDEYRVVAFDDVGHEYVSESGWSVIEVINLLRHRYDLALPTIITTNEPYKDWGRRYSPELQSLLREAFEIVPVVGEDYRERRRRQ